MEMVLLSLLQVHSDWRCSASDLKMFCLQKTRSAGSFNRTSAYRHARDHCFRHLLINTSAGKCRINTASNEGEEACWGCVSSSCPGCIQPGAHFQQKRPKAKVPAKIVPKIVKLDEGCSSPEKNPWSAWGKCSAVACGKRGFQVRHRLGSGCGTHIQSKQCHRICGCEVPSSDPFCAPAQSCEVSQWGSWSPCSPTCGIASKSRKRSVVQKQIGKARRCPSLQETKLCNAIICSSHPGLHLSRQAPGVDQHRWLEKLSIVRLMKCDCKTSRSERCHRLKKMYEINHCYECEHACGCELSSWGAWGSCVPACGNRSQLRKRRVSTPNLPGGKRCASFTREERQPCKSTPCSAAHKPSTTPTNNPAPSDHWLKETFKMGLLNECDSAAEWLKGNCV